MWQKCILKQLRRSEAVLETEHIPFNQFKAATWTSDMNNRAFLYLMIVVSAGVGGIVLANIITVLRPIRQQPCLSYNDVQGMAIEHRGISYTLNFHQQNEMIKYLNAENKYPLQRKITEASASIGLTIYQFGTEPITIYDFNLKCSDNDAGCLQDLAFLGEAPHKRAEQKDTSFEKDIRLAD